MSTFSPARTWAAWGVHLYTASGAPLGLVALIASGRGDFGLAFACMTLATFIDSTDGALARRVGVKEVLPRFDGAKLDDIVDYLNYAVVPIVLAYQASLLPAGLLGLVVGSAPLLASGYGFSQTEAKTADHFFTGFPSYWNVVVFYLYTLQTPLWFNVSALLGFSVLVFVPIRYLYPSRSTSVRTLTYVLATAWALVMFELLREFPHPSQQLAFISLFFPAYYMAASFHIHLRTARAPHA
ncbi:MAG: CDP-diacylglycerol O-phosphatidyltransferase [Deltaproteobacteria bacterium]|nr:CDP-diacylglycerol O-phosphatidyltransferase [Deltaproteobacteria bacterium]MBI3387383.1 CDP-diacylglycerol O-phosphatidyltransferase [Deltaproteobacteria bacterium]